MSARSEVILLVSVPPWEMGTSTSTTATMVPQEIATVLTVAIVVVDKRLRVVECFSCRSDSSLE